MMWINLKKEKQQRKERLQKAYSTVIRIRRTPPPKGKALSGVKEKNI